MSVARNNCAQLHNSDVGNGDRASFVLSHDVRQPDLRQLFVVVRAWRDHVTWCNWPLDKCARVAPVLPGNTSGSPKAVHCVWRHRLGFNWQVGLGHKRGAKLQQMIPCKSTRDCLWRHLKVFTLSSVAVLQRCGSFEVVTMLQFRSFSPIEVEEMWQAYQVRGKV